jgi:hypothetical protein
MFQEQIKKTWFSATLVITILSLIAACRDMTNKPLTRVDLNYTMLQAVTSHCARQVILTVSVQLLTQEMA